MSVTDEYIIGLEQPFLKNGVGIPRISFIFGNAVEVYVGVYLSAAHVIYGPVLVPGTNPPVYVTYDGQGVFFINPTNFVNNNITPERRSLSGANQVNKITKLTGYSPIAAENLLIKQDPSLGVNDLVMFSGASTTKKIT